MRRKGGGRNGLCRRRCPIANCTSSEHDTHRIGETAMSIRNWPKPVRVLFGYSILTLVLLVSCGPLAFAVFSEDFWESLGPTGHAYVAYTVATAGATSAITSMFACWRMPSKLKYKLGPYLLGGAIIGLLVGMCLIPFTVGASFFLAPPSGVLGALLIFVVRIASRRTSPH